MKTNNIALAIAAVLAAACASQATHTMQYDARNPGGMAKATLAATKDSTVKGTVSFLQRGDQVVVSANIQGLKPNGEHGFHVHEKGDCSSGDGMSAGGHYNPAGKPHGDHRAGGERHAGDLPNLKADANGNAVANFVVSGISVGGANADIVGKGLIVHRDPDDYKTQPTGNAGPRMACAVITAG